MITTGDRRTWRVCSPAEGDDQFSSFQLIERNLQNIQTKLRDIKIEWHDGLDSRAWLP